MSAISKIRDADINMRAALIKIDALRAEMQIPDTNHTWSKARMFLTDALEGMPRCACGRVTDMACSDCRIDTRATVYVCESTTCRATHEANACSRIPSSPTRSFAGEGLK